MAGIELRDYQIDAIRHMHNGCILYAGVGRGKSRTALAYYYLLNGGKLPTDEYVPMDDPPMDLYIITTARKRDTLEWNKEMVPFLLSTNPEVNLYANKVVVDSWNNIGKYTKVERAFFIFDEQRVVGKGAWVKAFLKITQTNQWVLLSATPGDTWSDYIPVFIANGFYKNRTEFTREHIVYKQFSKYPQVDRYLNTGRLIRLRNKVLVDMGKDSPAASHHEEVYTHYDISRYRDASKRRWDPYKDEPIKDAAGLCLVWRRIVNTDASRQVALLEILDQHPRAIVFYNFDYELDLLKDILKTYEVAEWNGHKHQPIPTGDKWVYLVHYNAGAEGWNCITTNTIIFYSQNYSYKTMTQAAGRIDRMNTPFTDLYYYHLKSRSGIDLAISKALDSKKEFNETRFTKKFVKW